MGRQVRVVSRSPVPCRRALRARAARSGLAAVSALLLAAPWPRAAGAAEGGVHTLLPGEKVSAVFSSEGDARICGLGLLEGTKFKLSVKAAKRSGARPAVQLADPVGAAVDLGGASRSAAGRGEIVQFTATHSGVWRATLSTPPSGGGGVDIALSAKSPARATAAGVATGGAGAVTFAALPGTVLKSLTARVAAKPAWTPSIEIVAPSGALVAVTSAAKPTAALRGVVLPELGTYTVRVAGGDGAFKVQASFKPPAPRKSLTWRDVEPTPEITGFDPVSADNDSSTTFRFLGVGITTHDRVSFKLDGKTKLAANFFGPIQGGAQLFNELVGLPAGEYTLEVATPAGNVADIPGRLTVTNRRPVIGFVYPPFIPWGTDLPVFVNGAGFDPAATVAVRRSSDQTVIPTTVKSRAGHKDLTLEIDPAPYVTGPCDIVITDPGAAPQTFPRALDLVGWRAAPRSIVSYSGTTPSSSFYPVAAGYDDAGGRVLLSVQEGRDARFVLLDATTLATLDTLRIVSPNTSTTLRPREVAFDPVAGAWWLSWTHDGATSDSVRVRIVDGVDLDVVRSDHTLDTAPSVNRIAVVPDPVAGGALVVWGRFDGAGEIRAWQLDSNGLTTGPQPATLASQAQGWAYHPSSARRSDGSCVVAYIGLNEADALLAVRRLVVHANGTTKFSDIECATDAAWYIAGDTFVSVDPRDDTALIAFTYDDGLVQAEYHPGTIALTGASLHPGAVVTVDDDGEIPEGFVDSLVWNPARNEHVVACTVIGNRVILRRITPAGAIRVAPTSHDMEGVWGVLWCGRGEDTLGFVRQSDGTEDDAYTYLSTMRVTGGPMR